MSTEATRTFTSMASQVTLRVIDPTPHAHAALAAAQQVFEDVAAACTRFDPASPLMRANAQPDAWHIVPRVCSDAIAAAHAAYMSTGGRFDPRVHNSLVAAGYGAARSFSDAPELGPLPQAPSIECPTWAPAFDGRSVCLGGTSIDLGGIGKGLAVRWAAAELEGSGNGFMVEAGGDLITHGSSPDGGPWLVGIENPWNATGDPIAVVNASDAAVATSSIRLRSWVHDGRVRHHLIDPRTGEPGGAGLLSVTVIGSDPADAEVLSKALFLEGAAGIADAADAVGAAALWVTIAGGMSMTQDAADRLVWQVQHAQR